MSITGGISARLSGAAASVGDMVVGTGVAEHAVLDAVGAARGKVMLEAICFDNEAAFTALASTLGAGTDVGLAGSHLVRPRKFAGSADVIAAIQSGQLRIVNYDDLVRAAGVDPVADAVRWEHSKNAAFELPDGRHVAWFSNYAPNVDSHLQSDAAVQLLDDTARAAYDVVHATAESAQRGTAPTAAAIDAAAGVGLLYNDALTGRNYFTAGTDSLVHDAGRRLVLITKGLDDVEVAHGLVAAADRGVLTGLATRRLGHDAAAVLAGSKVRMAIAPRDAVYDRMNLLISDDTGLLSTGYHSSAILRPDAHGMLAGRDSAIVLRGAGLERMEAALDGTDKGRVARLLMTAEPEPVRGLRALFGRGSSTAPAYEAAYDLPVTGGRYLRLGDPKAASAMVDKIG